MTAQSAAEIVEPEGDSSARYPLCMRSHAVYSASAREQPGFYGSFGGPQLRGRFGVRQALQVNLVDHRLMLRRELGEDAPRHPLDKIGARRASSKASSASGEGGGA